MATRIAGQNLVATVIDYGLRLVSLEYLYDDGSCQQLVQGGWSVDEYERDTAYHGAVIGRTCNRIREGALQFLGQSFQLDRNEGPHHLHGGQCGLHNRIWQVETDDNGLTARTKLKDGEAGYPGNVDVEVEIDVKDDTLNYVYSGRADQDTMLDLTNHAYFSLDDADSILDQELLIDGEVFVPVDDDLIPLGQLVNVSGSVFDFRQFKRLGDVLNQDDLQLRIARGIDHCWLLKSGPGSCARLRSKRSGIELQITTSNPGIQVYTGNNLDNIHSAICLETQHLPDACHHDVFHAPLLLAGQPFDSSTSYRFVAISGAAND